MKLPLIGDVSKKLTALLGAAGVTGFGDLTAYQLKWVCIVTGCYLLSQGLVDAVKAWRGVPAALPKEPAE